MRVLIIIHRLCIYSYFMKIINSKSEIPQICSCLLPNFFTELFILMYQFLNSVTVPMILTMNRQLSIKYIVFCVISMSPFYIEKQFCFDKGLLCISYEFVQVVYRDNVNKFLQIPLNCLQRQCKKNKLINAFKFFYGYNVKKFLLIHSEFLQRQNKEIPVNSFTLFTETT